MGMVNFSPGEVANIRGRRIGDERGVGEVSKIDQSWERVGREGIV